jgi:glycolate oxidase
VTEIILQLRPLPTARVVLVVPFADVEGAIAAVPALMTEGRLIPSSIEFMDRLSVETACHHLGEAPPHADLGALLLIELDGTDRAQVDAEADRVVDLCLASGALDVYVGNTPSTETRMWRPRQVVAEAFKVAAPVQILEDIVVPPARIPALMAELERLAEEFGVPIPCYGHAGDGNLHATPVKPAGMSIEQWHEAAPRLLAALYEAVARLGGTISGEHGIGSKRAAYLPLALDPAVIALQRRIKRAFDPLGVLNPGKIFPEES